ncbi:hypothetical protein D3C77_276740 [compost metagenome]
MAKAWLVHSKCSMGQRQAMSIMYHSKDCTHSHNGTSQYRMVPTMNDDLIKQLETQIKQAQPKPKLWTPGQTLRISFVNIRGDVSKKAIYDIACEWLKYAYLHFELVDDKDASAEIRINAFEEGHEYTEADWDDEDSNDIDSNMTISWVPDDPNSAADILRQTGSILGMEIAQFHPDATIPWNFDYIRKNYREDLDEQQNLQLSDDDIDYLIRIKLTSMSNEVQIALGYDEQSIMHDPLYTEFTVAGWKTEPDTTLSEKDKQFMALVYPGRSEA